MLPTCSSTILPLALSSACDFSTCSCTNSIDLKYLTVFTCNSRCAISPTARNHEPDHTRTCGGILIHDDESPRMELKSRKSPLVNGKPKSKAARVVDDVQGDSHPPLRICC